MRTLLPLAALVGLAVFLGRRLATAPTPQPAPAPQPLPRGAYLHLLTDAEFVALRDATAAGRLH